MYSKCICGMFCSCVQKYDLISVRCRVDTGRGAATTGHCHRRVPHHPIIRDQCWPALLTTIHLLKYLKYWNLCWTRPGLATMMLRSVVVSLDVKFRILQPPSSSYPGPQLVFSFLVLRNVRRLPTKYEVAWKPSINTTISHRYWITLEIFVHSRKNIGTASGEWMEAM